MSPRIEVKLRPQPTVDEANFSEDLTVDEIAAIQKVEELSLDEIVTMLKEIEDDEAKSNDSNGQAQSSETAAKEET